MGHRKKIKGGRYRNCARPATIKRRLPPPGPGEKSCAPLDTSRNFFGPAAVISKPRGPESATAAGIAAAVSVFLGAKAGRQIAFGFGRLGFFPIGRASCRERV